MKRREFFKGSAITAGAFALSPELLLAQSPQKNVESVGRLKDRDWTMEEMVYGSRRLREIIQSCPHRPRFHLMAPEAGATNDVNGLLYWKGRYHFCILGRMPIPDTKNPYKDHWRGRVWFHSSSEDMVHWIHHPPIVKSNENDTNPDYLGPQSGTNIMNAPTPTFIYHYGRRYGTSIVKADNPEDPYLVDWSTFPQNPVIPSGIHPEVKVHDPCSWYADGTYYALIGGKNYRKGYEGDCASLFRSKNLIDWEYRGPFYKSKREWTDVDADAACPSFFPIGDRYMLLMHCHRPYRHCHYYLGKFDTKNERFLPEEYGKMSWPGGHLAGPEAFIDGKGRVIMAAWILEGGDGQSRWLKKGYASCISLPRVLSLNKKGKLQIQPVPELNALRWNHKTEKEIFVKNDNEECVESIKGNCIELKISIKPGNSKIVGVIIGCNQDNSEMTQIFYDRLRNTLSIKEIRKNDSEPFVSEQKAPFMIPDGEDLELNIFFDHSVVEVFANKVQCMTQRIYPGNDSNEIKYFAKGGNGMTISQIDAWDMKWTSSL
jgi:beta-fructofuranosidase